ncbi:MAG: beta-lactamase family protein, partial [Deltaproteobacteria bacterium]|nr:beta-lactamase family protein [Deltaproteobacteria bacterium]
MRPVFPGAVLIAAYKGEVRFLKAVGNRALFPQQEPMAPDTIFDLASLTKPLATSVALMKLVDKEELDLDEPLEHILEGEGLGDKAPLTPRLLLCHRSGLPD